MKSLEQLIESVFAEVLKELAPEAPADAPFGQYLWAPNRKDLEGEEKWEDNTPIENRFRDALFQHYQGDPDMLGSLAAKVKNMVAQGWYEKILAPPEETVYRYITNVPTETAARILGTSVGDLEKDALKYPGIPQSHGSGMMKPGGSWSGTSGISSWSTQLDWEWISLDLTPPPVQPGETAILLAADAGSGTNFFINPSNIHNVERLPDYAYYQNEVIAYGPVKYARAWVLTNSKEGKQRIDAIEAEDAFFALESEVDY